MNTKPQNKNIIIDNEANELLRKAAYEQKKTKKELASEAIKKAYDK